ncbi:MAG: heparinase II/III domain-containing protein [Candidatus Puniceispirillales bacterium]
MTDWALPWHERFIRRSVLFGWRLRKIAPSPPTHWFPADLWRGVANAGQPLVSGNHPVETLEGDWHRFGWLRDMREFGGSQSRTMARRLVVEWVNQYGRWSEAEWHPSHIAARLKSIVLLWGWFGESAALSQQQMIVTSMAIQLDCLKRDWRSLNEPNARVEALTAIIISRLFLDPDADIDAEATALVDEISGLVLADGGHVSRRPDRHLDLLQGLIEARTALAAAKSWQPAFPKASADALQTLDETIVSMGAIGRMWRHVDGSLMAIPGAFEVDPDMFEQVLLRAGPSGKVTHHAGDSGFIRLASGRSVLLMNSAPSPWVSTDNQAADAGVLAIEFSNGSNRIIINAGQRLDLAETSPDLALALAGTAAHSTLSIDHLNAADTETGDRRATGKESATGPVEGGMAAIADHDGYETTHGVLHTRRVFLSTGGYDLRGEDQIRYMGLPGAIPAEAIIRFHLHPRISASLSIGGTVMLRLPGAAAPWAFKASGGSLAVEDSIMMGEKGLEKTSQIILQVSLEGLRNKGVITARWGLRRQATAKK